MTFDAVAFLTGLFAPTAPSDGGPAAPRVSGIDVAATPQDLPPAWHFAWDERAAILEFDAGLPRERAEALALEDVLEQVRRARVNRHNDTCN